MNFLWFLLVMLPLSTALKPCSKDGKPCTWRHFANTSLGNQALCASNLISSHNIHFLGECHILCVNTHNCYGYNFRVRPSNVFPANCQLGNSTVKMNMTKIGNGSWIFYEDILVTKDIDECSQHSNTCHSNATCINSPGSYDCHCRNGYTGNGHTCTDINECLDKSIDCDSNANCLNTDGSYKCKCNQGYLGNGHNCTDIDECSQNSDTCDAKATCTNNPGSYDCQCRSGYTGNGKKCTDIDECSQDSNTCHSNAACINSPGSYGCQCKNGYTGNGQTCTDIDECSQNSDTCDAKATCTNTPGSYDCQCRNGYTGNGKKCTDIDECSQNSNTCDAKATCTNTPGSYDCQCRNGYTGNGKKCTDIDECSQDSNTCHSDATCINSPGSFYCQCKNGYTGNGQTCTDIDECSQNSNTCDAKATCTNTPGSYDCQCRNGYTGNGNTCTEVNCKTLAGKTPKLSSGEYLTGSIMAYCEIPSGWTLIARFSNNDGKNWMNDANFWYEKMSAIGSTRITSSNEDMISEAFWKTQANEIKITRSDDPTHTALLETTNNCLKGKTFRAFITSFGNFRNQNIWASDKCLGNCNVKYGGQYQTTTGFEKYGCSSDIQSSNYIGFWCDWSSGDGAVMMIGGGGSGCDRADHGIGITEENEAKFGGNDFLDFGFDTDNSASYQTEEIQKSYALNLWVR